MGLFNSSKKGDSNKSSKAGSSWQDASGSQYTTTSHPQPSSTKEEYYQPPPGPPPSYVNAQVQYAPPPGPPPGHESFAPPPGPPLGHDSYAPPPGPPPNHAGSDPPPNEDWKIIPDTSLLPPPPSMAHDMSEKSNADLSEADRAHDWCDANPLVRPHQPSQAQWNAVQSGDVRMLKPVEYGGDLIMPEIGTWRGSTRAGAVDSCLISSAPLYFAYADDPAKNGRKKTIYFEIEIKSLGRGHRNEECSLAIGYCALPYPTWRMPGWERGSLAVHSDDGRRYVANTWGGKDFTAPIKQGDTVGLGMTFTVSTNLPSYDTVLSKNTELDAEIFFTRNGQKDGGWNLHEELDADKDQGIEGLDGASDLYAAVGVFGGAEFVVRFKRDNWMWLPR